MNTHELSKTKNFNAELKLKGFAVYEIDNLSAPGYTYSRKDFYKVNITTGKHLFHYSDKSIETDETFLFCANPHIPYSCEPLTPNFTGYTCLFSEEFLKLSDRSESFQQSPLFKIGGTPILKLDNEQREFITSIFKRMLAEQNTDYAYKGELVRNYLNLIKIGRASCRERV